MIYYRLLALLFAAILSGVALGERSLEDYKKCRYPYKDCGKPPVCQKYVCKGYKCELTFLPKYTPCYLKYCNEKAECNGYGTCECKKECDDNLCKSYDPCVERKCSYGKCKG